MAVIVFTGELDPDAFTLFVQHRAARLAIQATVLEAGPDHVRVAVAGPAALIDAFELACSLGPHSCVVRDVARD